MLSYKGHGKHKFLGCHGDPPAAMMFMKLTSQHQRPCQQYWELMCCGFRAVIQTDSYYRAVIQTACSSQYCRQNVPSINDEGGGGAFASIRYTYSLIPGIIWDFPVSKTPGSLTPQSRMQCQTPGSFCKKLWLLTPKSQAPWCLRYHEILTHLNTKKL